MLNLYKCFIKKLWKIQKVKKYNIIFFKIRNVDRQNYKISWKKKKEKDFEVKKLKLQISQL